MQPIMLKHIAVAFAMLAPSTAFQPALTVHRVVTRTATPSTLPGNYASKRTPVLAVSAGGASPGGGRLAAVLRVLRSVGTISGLFVAAGLAEIGGGWLIWKAVREGAPRWWAACGALVLAVYGFIPCLQPIDDFGRLYAAYGGVFIGMSFAWAKVVDGMVLDKGDIIGSAVTLVGVAIVLLWPRK